jgi:hypothetical protein
LEKNFDQRLKYIVHRANRISIPIGSEIVILKIYQDDEFPKESLVLCHAYSALLNIVFRKRMIDCSTIEIMINLIIRHLLLNFFPLGEKRKFYLYHRE